MKQSFDTPEAFLKDTLRYYSADPDGRRCSDKVGKCKYSPYTLHKEDTSEGCAIGRHLQEDDAKFLDSREVMNGSYKYLADEFKDIFPGWMIMMNRNFIDQVQRLHDRSENWNSAGLTDKGFESVKSIISEFQLNEAEVFPC